MECSEAKLKVQALIDNELAEEEISHVVDHIQSCYSCRDEYISLLRLQRRMRGVGHLEPSKEWFEQLSKRRFRKVGSFLGQLLFFGSYVLLVGYTFVQLFSDNGEDLFIKLVVGGIILGVLALAGVTIADRVRENKTDRYKEVMK